MEENKQEQQTDTASVPATEEKQPARIRNKYAEKLGKRRFQMPKWVKKLIFAVFLAGIIVLAVFLVKTANQSADTSDAENQTSFAMYQPLETYVEGVGTTAAKNTEQYGKEIKGEVLTVEVAIGDMVKAGDVLFTVDPEATRKELDTAVSELDDAQRQVDEAASELQKAQKNLHNLSIAAPFSGKIIPSMDSDGNVTAYKVGQTLSEGTLLGTMVDDTVMRLPLYFNEIYLDKIKVGAAAQVSIPVSMSNVTGKVASIERIQKISDEGVKLFRVNLTMSNPGTLKGDMAATATVFTADGNVLPADAGTLEYNREEAVTADVGGEIVKINGLDNYLYQAGDVICQLESTDAKTAIGTAQRSLESAQKTVTSKQERVAELQKQIAESTVTAKIEGIVTNLTATEGQKLDGSSNVCTIADLTSIIVNADVSELDIDKVQNDMSVILTMDQDESIQYTGTVTSVSMQAKNSSGDSGGQSGNRVFPAVITLDAQDAAKLSPDRSVSYKIIVAQKENCLVVPSTAIVYTETGAAVYARQTEGVTFENAQPVPEGSEVPADFVIVPVETGIFDENNTEIVSGVAEGTEVFLAAPQDVYAMDEGMMVG